MCAVQIEVKLSRADKVYRYGDVLRGVVETSCRGDIYHDGISLLLLGHLDFINSAKQLQLLRVPLHLSPAGLLPSGTTELPFEMCIEQQPDAPGKREPVPLYETYYGVLIKVTYRVHAELRRGLLAKEARHSVEFTLLQGDSVPGIKREPFCEHAVNFVISPQSSSGHKAASGDLRMRGRFDSVQCRLPRPLTGNLLVEHCSAAIRSVELQLLRSETVLAEDSSHTSEIQTIQVVAGDPTRNIPIPLHMVFPRSFTCASVDSVHFRLNFSVNLVVVFEDDHTLTENYPLVLHPADIQFGV